MSLSRTVFEISTLFAQNLRQSRDPGHAPFRVDLPSICSFVYVFIVHNNFLACMRLRTVSVMQCTHSICGCYCVMCSMSCRPIWMSQYRLLCTSNICLRRSPELYRLVRWTELQWVVLLLITLPQQEERSIVMTLSVCVCPHGYLLNHLLPFLCVWPTAVDRSSSSGVPMLCTSDLWMTSCLPIIGSAPRDRRCK